MMDIIELACDYAWSLLHKPYMWGGDDPMAGFDCSGYIIDILKSVGRLPIKGDWKASELKNLFPISDYPQQGCLVFIGDPIRHVQFLYTRDLTLGADGGGRKIKTIQDAIDKNAYIKLRPLGKYNFICDPFEGFRDETPYIVGTRGTQL